MSSVGDSFAAPAPAIPQGLSPGVAAAWRRFYADYRDDAFMAHVAGLVRPEMQVLEIGAGSGRGQQGAFPLKGKCARYVGVDLDKRVADNPRLDEAHVCDADALPFEPNRFALVFHRFVAEHLRDPRRTFAETLRVLRPGGSVVFLTPSKFYYPMVAAQLIPEWVHSKVLAWLWPHRKTEDHFETFYRINTAAAIARCAKGLGASVTVRSVSTPPGYLRRYLPLFLAGVLYERTLEQMFAPLRATLWATMTKPT